MTTSPLSEALHLQPVPSELAQKQSGGIELARLEWLNSCCHDEIFDANVKWLQAQTPYSFLFVSPELPRRNDGRVSESLLKKYRHVEAGGWECTGVNVLTGQNTADWGQFKPLTPRLDAKGKIIKYEAPPQIATEIFALRIPVAIWQMIAHRYDVTLPSNYKDVTENPFIFWQWVFENPQIPVIITEGAKKAGCILSRGYVAIALPGVRSGYRIPRDEDGEPLEDSKPTLIPHLQVFATPGRKIYFAFDQDARRETRRDVNQALARTARLFKRQGCEVAVMSWDSKLGKGIDDFCYNSQILGLDIEESFGKLYRNAQSFDTWESQQLKQLTYPVSQLLNRRYLLNLENPNDTLPPASAQAIAIDSSKDSGKTTWIKKFVEPFLYSGEKRVLLISHRVQLSTQTADGLGIPYVTSVQKEGQKDLLGMALCIDSLHLNSQAKFNPEHWGNSIVIIDEIMQFLSHLLSSSTCRKERVLIIRNLKTLLQNVIKSGGKIIIADADFNDIAIDFIKGLTGLDINFWIIKNEFKYDKPWTVYHFNHPDATQLLGSLEKGLEKGEKHLLCLSAQKRKSKHSSTCLEQKFQKKYPDLKILRIDSETVQDPTHPAFDCGARLNKIIGDYDLVICTPTIETGVSIDEKHFQGVWGVFQGVSAADSVRQFLSRYRPPVPRYIWIAKKGLGFVGNGSTNYRELLKTQYQTGKAHIKRLTEAGFEENLDGVLESICLTTWAKLGAITNQGHRNYSQQVLADLESEGHIIKDSSQMGDDNRLTEINEAQVEVLKAEIKANKGEVYSAHKLAVSTSEDLGDDKYNELKKRQRKTASEQLELEKARLKRSYKVEVTPDLVDKNDKGWFPEIQLDYYLTKGREFLNDKDASAMRALNSQGQYFTPDVNRSMLGKKIDALDYLGIQRLYKEGSKFSKDHEVILDIFDKLKKNSYNLKLILGTDFSKVEQPIEAVQLLLGLLGQKMVCVGREGPRGKQVRYYSSPAPDFLKEPIPEEECKKVKSRYKLNENKQPIPLSDGRDEVFTAWRERDLEAKAKADKLKAWLQAERQAIATAQRKEQEKWVTPESLADIQDLLEACQDEEILLSIKQCGISVKTLKKAATFISDTNSKNWLFNCLNRWEADELAKKI
ncbi:MAG: DUF3854 domain-containing protein [Rhizonema sp. NSF051]|nr:DUF3854 domain-containing protein [Rhizonema sp. NSF051]